ncbi:hypothetical protein GCM10010174_79220 [Kutzneria viridogrisea]
MSIQGVLAVGRGSRVDCGQEWETALTGPVRTEGTPVRAVESGVGADTASDSVGRPAGAGMGWLEISAPRLPSGPGAGIAARWRPWCGHAATGAPEGNAPPIESSVHSRTCILRATQTSATPGLNHLIRSFSVQRWDTALALGRAVLTFDRPSHPKRR